MQLQILRTEIIPRHEYSNYRETKLIDQAMQCPDSTLLKVEFIYRGYLATGHILIESAIFQESQEFIYNKIKKILIGWAEKNFYRVPNEDGNENIIVH